MSKKLRRYFYLGTSSIESDPSRLELRDSLARHAPTTVQIGNFKRIFHFPCLPRTAIFKSGNIALDLLEHKISASSSMKPLIRSFIDNTTIGHFWTTKTTSRGDDGHSRDMYLRTYVEQQHHLLMLEQMHSVYQNVDPRHMFVILYHFLHPDEPLPPVPVLDEAGINAVRILVRAFYVPHHQTGYVGDIPGLINVENRVLVRNHQIKSFSSGFIFEFKLLSPTLLMLR